VSKEDKGIVRESIEDGSIALSSVILPLLMMGHPLLAAAIAAVGGVVGKRGISSVVGRRLRANERCVNTLLFDPTLSPRAAKDRAKERMNDPKFVEVLWQTIHRLSELPDLAVIPSITALGKMYQNESRDPDSFFRGCMGMLVDCDAQGLEDIRAVFAVSRESSGEFALRTFIRLNAPSTMEPTFRSDGTLRKPHAAITVSDGTQLERKRDPKSTRVASREMFPTEPMGNNQRNVDSIPYGRAGQVVQRLSIPGVGLRRDDNGSECAAVLREEMDRLAIILDDTPVA
jgi:hypothetical protein